VRNVHVHALVLRTVLPVGSSRLKTSNSLPCASLGGQRSPLVVFVDEAARAVSSLERALCHSHEIA
jgi:hypothetical protein